jgi:hypothetical protein
VLVSRDGRSRTAEVLIGMTLGEFRETVEWLESLAPADGCTRDWRKWLDEIDPPEADDDR